MGLAAEAGIPQKDKLSIQEHRVTIWFLSEIHGNTLVEWSDKPNSICILMMILRELNVLIQMPTPFPCSSVINNLRFG